MFLQLVYEIGAHKRKKQYLEIHCSIKGSFLLSDILTDRHGVGRSWKYCKCLSSEDNAAIKPLFSVQAVDRLLSLYPK